MYVNHKILAPLTFLVGAVVAQMSNHGGSTVEQHLEVLAVIQIHAQSRVGVYTPHCLLQFPITKNYTL